MAKTGLFLSKYPAGLGCDAAGVVEEIGSEVTTFKPGDEIFAGTTVGGIGHSSFAEFCLAPVASAMKKPANLSFAEAAAVPWGLMTAAFGLFVDLGVPGPPLFDQPLHGSPLQNNNVLIWGASGSVGSMAVQLAKRSGMNVIAVAGASNLEYVKSLGAAHTISRQDSPSSILEQIAQAAPGGLLYAMDCVGPETAGVCLKALSPGGRLSAAVGFTQTDVPADITATFTLTSRFATDQAETGAKVLKWAERALADGDLVVSPRVRLLLPGMESVLDGLRQLEEGKVSAEKLVATW